MSSRDNHLWLQLWRDRQTDFHQETTNQFLARFWPGLNCDYGSRVFVPLCGKSLDMIWLAKQGHEVIGVELSPIAVKEFFKENHLKPVRRRLKKFDLWTHGNISILCGDYFSLKKSDLGHIDMVYDRAALTALPEDVRRLYVNQLRLIVSQTTDVFLLTIEDMEYDKALPQVPSVDEEIKALYAEDFEINLAHSESMREYDRESPGLSTVYTEHKVYQLSKKSYPK